MEKVNTNTRSSWTNRREYKNNFPSLKRDASKSWIQKETQKAVFWMNKSDFKTEANRQNNTILRKFKTNPGIKYAKLEIAGEFESLEIDQNTIAAGYLLPAEWVRYLFSNDICSSSNLVLIVCLYLWYFVYLFRKKRMGA